MNKRAPKVERLRGRNRPACGYKHPNPFWPADVKPHNKPKVAQYRVNGKPLCALHAGKELLRILADDPQYEEMLRKWP